PEGRRAADVDRIGGRGHGGGAGQSGRGADRLPRAEGVQRSVRAPVRVRVRDHGTLGRSADREAAGRTRPPGRGGGQGMSQPGTVRVAAIQTVSGPDVDENLRAADALVAEAAANGARLVALPEYFALLSPDETAKLRAAETPGDGPIQRFLSGAARRHGVWIVGGTLPLAARTPGR